MVCDGLATLRLLLFFCFVFLITRLLGGCLVSSVKRWRTYKLLVWC